MIRFLMASILLLIGAMSFPDRAQAHALDPGYLQMDSVENDMWQIYWRKPAVSGRPMPIEVVLPDNCMPARSSLSPRFDGAAFVSRWITTCPGGISNRTLSIQGLEATKTDVIVRYSLSQGAYQTQRLTGEEAEFLIPQGQSRFGALLSYFDLGLGHILEGWDHLLFVFALLVLVRSPWRLVGAVTAFTLSHSITLALATLGWIRVPIPPVEAIIALSIVLLSVEIIYMARGREQMTSRFPWMVSFGFGLLHGLGFASALGEIGLPEEAVVLALLAFNIGVEVGQLIFIAVIAIAYLVLRLVMPDLVQTMRNPRSGTTVVIGYAIGGIALFWLAERVAGF